MVGKTWKYIRQYTIVLVVAIVVVLLYMACYRDGKNLFLALDKDKAIDDFVRLLLQSADKNTTITFTMCNYNIQNIIIFLLCKITGNVYQGLNIYYIVSFLLIAVLMFWYLQKLHISFGVATYISVLVSVLPYHIDRGQGQIITSTFFLVPVFAGIWNDVIYNKITKLNKYYLVVFCLAPFIDIRLSVMVIILGIILAIHRRDKEIIKTMIVYEFPITILTFILNQFTKELSSDNLEASIRLAREEGMRILDLLMPLRNHFLDRFFNIRYEYDVDFAANGEAGLNSMGILLSMFFVFSIIAILLNLKTDKRIIWMAWISIVVILISNINGFNILFEYIGIHVGYWNRMAIFIIVNTAAIMGIMTDKLHIFLIRKMNISLVNTVLVIIGILGILDIILRHNMVLL